MTKITNKPLFFLSGDVKLVDGKLTWKQGWLSLIGGGKNEVEIASLKVLKVSKGVLNPHITLGGKKPGHDSPFPDYDFLFTIKLPKSQVSALIQLIRETVPNAPVFSGDLEKVMCGKGIYKPQALFAAEPAYLPDCESVWCYNDRAIVADENGTSPVYYKDIRFFNQSKEGVLFGYQKKYSVKKLRGDAAKALKEVLISHGAELHGTMEGETYKGSKGLCFWKRNEELVVGKDGVSFSYSKGKKSDSLYLPYKDIVAVGKGSKLTIFGKQNIISETSFSSEARKAIAARVAEHAQGYAKKYVKSYFKLLGLIPLWSRPSYGQIGYSEKGVVIILRKKDRKEGKLPPVISAPMENVHAYHRKGKNFVIVVSSGNVREFNEEQLQGHVHYIGFSKMSGAGDLLSTIKNNAKKLFESTSKDDVKKAFKNYKF